jgi:putative endonuclease
MFSVYILFSPKIQKTYVGFTSDIEKRLLSHNELGNKDWASKHRPWILIHTESYETKSEAMKREKYLKSGAGRAWIKANLDFSNLNSV